MEEDTTSSPAESSENPSVEVEKAYLDSLARDLQLDLAWGEEKITMKKKEIDALKKTHEEWLTLGGKSYTSYSLRVLGDRLDPRPPAGTPAVSPETLQEIMEKRNTLIGALLALRSDELITDAIPEADQNAFETSWENVAKIRVRATDAIGGDEKPFSLDNAAMKAIDDFRKKTDLALAYDNVMGTPTEQSLQRALQTADLIESLDPMRAREWRAVQERTRGGGILEKPAHLLIGGVATILFIMSLIPTIRKMLQGKDVGAMDIALTSGYAAAAAVALGLWPEGKKMELEKIAATTARFMGESYRPVRELVANTIGVPLTIKATRELHDALTENVTEQNALKKALKKALKTHGITKDFVEEHFSGYTALPVVLMEKCVNDKQRIRFLGTLLRENVQEESGRDAIIDVWENLDQLD